MLVPIDPAAHAARLSRTGFGERTLMWIESKSFDVPGQVEPIGIWTGADAETIQVTDHWSTPHQLRNRIFYGAGEFLGIEDLTYPVGLDVRTSRVKVSGLGPAVIDALRVYNPRGARVQLWIRTYNGNGQPVGSPELVFKGLIEDAPIPRGVAPGTTGEVTMSLVSCTRFLTTPRERKRSDRDQRRRGGDTFRIYRASLKDVVVPWGQEDIREG